MITLNAILKAKPGSEEALYQALVEIGEHVSRSEPGTVGFYVGRDTQNPLLFNTYERFVDMEAMESHNNSPYRAEWGDKYGNLFDGDTAHYICEEIFSK